VRAAGLFSVWPRPATSHRRASPAWWPTGAPSHVYVTPGGGGGGGTSSACGWCLAAAPGVAEVVGAEAFADPRASRRRRPIRRKDVLVLHCRRGVVLPTRHDQPGANSGRGARLSRDAMATATDDSAAARTASPPVAAGPSHRGRHTVSACWISARWRRRRRRCFGLSYADGERAPVGGRCSERR
jgi:hypothetical protein